MSIQVFMMIATVGIAKMLNIKKLIMVKACGIKIIKNPMSKFKAGMIIENAGEGSTPSVDLH